ncbi:SpoIIE family protein phosphatase [Streptomyces sp. 3MP-14]|uniref:SpoIIE family protein phosphatase n=1 Tax=Streptomyces mimosae TaxID=2586635 RepID=A0A5N6A604_9ACTN|nr:SpoIIE family protein phosphatase [Streptomyces mimosae]KAB8174690.1 SpoIIE family protein phosphatase [Streptomyces sp. 3MP-14]
MSTPPSPPSPPSPKVAGIQPPLAPVSHTPGPPFPEGRSDARPAEPVPRPGPPEDRLAGWISDLTALQALTERIGRTGTLREAVEETLRAGARLLGARRGLLALRGQPEDGRPGGGERLLGLGLDRAELGQWETVPRVSACHARLLDEAVGAAGEPDREIGHHDIARTETLHPRHRAVAARLGCSASYALPLTAEAAAPFGAALWLFDRPGQPEPRQRRLLGHYLRHAARHIAGRQELARANEALATVRDGLLPGRLPRMAGVTLAARESSAPGGGPVCWDALPLPDGGLGLAVGASSDAGPAALAAMGRLRAGLRAYAVMEGEDPVAVLSDLELLLRLTEPGRPATALFGYAEPAARRLVLASAGHPPPLLLAGGRATYVDTTLSAPLNMLACWEAPSVELELGHGETVLLYSEGLLRRAGGPLDAAFAGLRAAALAAPPAVRADPEALVDHLLTALPAPGASGAGGPGAGGGHGDVVLLAARFH